MNKIGICGPSGTGKSTLAKWISEYYNIVNLDLSSKNLWPELGVTSHKEVITKSHVDPDWGVQFQGDVLAMRSMLLDRTSYSFVSDRTPLDSIPYMMLQSSMYIDSSSMQNFMNNAVIQLAKQYTHLIILPYQGNKIEDDKNRVTNIHYQFMVDREFSQAFKFAEETGALNKMKTLIITTRDMEQKQKEVKEFINLFGA